MKNKRKEKVKHQPQPQTHGNGRRMVYKNQPKKKKDFKRKQSNFCVFILISVNVCV